MKTVQVFVSAKNLANVDLISEADSICCLKIQSNAGGKFKLVGETETFDNNSNPKWVKHFKLTYHASQQQTLLFEIYDDDGDSRELLG